LLLWGTFLQECEAPLSDWSWLRHPAVLLAAGAVTGVVLYRVLYRPAPVVRQIDHVVYRQIPSYGAHPEPYPAAVFSPSEFSPTQQEKKPAAPKSAKKSVKEKTSAALVTAKEKAKRSQRGIPATESGVVIEAGRLRIADWNTWMTFAPKMMRIAVDAGAKTAPDVLRVVLNTSLPQYPWPPPADSRLHDQWDELTEVVATALGLPNPPPNGGQERESGSHLRLVQ
jgi:hypothetical protein